uniref:Uncharacterized protein n=1 Tax=viral metagenome TaxID=1070528 RepID=A0A6M3IRA3_9ZZZZ
MTAKVKLTCLETDTSDGLTLSDSAAQELRNMLPGTSEEVPDLLCVVESVDNSAIDAIIKCLQEELSKGWCDEIHS